MLSTAQVRAQWSDIRCNTSRSYAIDFGEGRILVHPDNVAVWIEVAKICDRHDYRIRRADTGSYNCRRITGGSNYSLHSYPGVSVDINWNSNPYSAANRLITDMPNVMVQEILAIRTNSGDRVLRWGGHFTTIKDAMHFEIICTRASLRSGIASRLSTTPKAPQGEDDEVLERGDSNDQVKLLQHDLNRYIYLTTARGYGGDGTPLNGGGLKHDAYGGSHLTVDGVYGNKTAEFVRHAVRRMRWTLGYFQYHDTGLWVNATIMARLTLAIEKELQRL